jgi:hypothetical protein
MCCIEPQKYFGGYYGKIADSLENDAVLPFIDGLPDRDSPAQQTYSRKQVPSEAMPNLTLRIQ